ncbi:MAG: cobalamin biosynthesis protein CbiX [Chthoniobacterales bacterium]|nr:cobalamin biosynthesis protein CbiX [Chthoniobacterales bacterium]
MESPFPPKPYSALLILAHGSSVNPSSSRPTRELAERLRSSGLFGEVACGFWKEEPGLREALDSLTKPEVFIVPNFTVEGYFVRKVIPKELGLAGPVTVRDNGQVIRLCLPVGGHPRMTEVLLHRAREAAPGVDCSRAAMLVLGHGTPLDARSSEAVEAQVAAMRARGIFAEVHGAFMETPPKIEDWRKITACRDVIAVPFFIADGLHSDEDIPRLLGIAGAGTAAEREGKNPHPIDGRRLYYSRAIGTDAGLAQVILDQVHAWELCARGVPRNGETADAAV